MDKQKKKADVRVLEQLKLAKKLVFDSRKTNQNLRKAIRCYTSALQAIKKGSAPFYWCIVQEGLGYAYYSLKPKSDMKNIYPAMDHFLSIFSVVPKNRKKDFEQVYYYLAVLSKRLLKYKNSNIAKSKSYKSYIRKLNRLFDSVLSE